MQEKAEVFHASNGQTDALLLNHLWSRDVLLQIFFLSFYRFYDASQNTRTSCSCSSSWMLFAKGWRWTLQHRGEQHGQPSPPVNARLLWASQRTAEISLLNIHFWHWCLLQKREQWSRQWLSAHVCLQAWCGPGSSGTGSPCITGTTSWRLQRLQLSQLLVSNLNLLKRSTETETLWCDKPHTTITRTLTKASALKLVINRKKKSLLLCMSITIAFICPMKGGNRPILIPS